MTVTRLLQTQTFFRSSFDVDRSDDRKYDCIPRVVVLVSSSQREFKGREPVMTVTRLLQKQAYFRSSFDLERSDDRKYDCIPRVLVKRLI